MTAATESLVSAAAKAEIDNWVKKFPPGKQQSALIPALRIVQDENGGWLTDDLIKAVAHYLQLPEIRAFEVATFYTLFDLKEVGKYKLYVCTNISCMLCGSDKIMSHLKNKLNIGIGETTEDGKFTLKEVECLAACGGAPAMQINREYHENLTPEKLDEILDNLE